jgi:genome maintenance exonuclease 1
MTFVYEKLPELDFELEAKTTESGRVYYTPSGKAYPSVTTVLGSMNKEAIDAWRKRVGEEEANKISGKASRRGEALHLACEKYLLNEMSDLKIRNMMPNIKELFFQLRPELDKNIGTIYAVEQPLYSDKLKIAGRVDCIAKWDGKISIIDFKTSSKEKLEENILNYFLQCAAYAEMFEELTKKIVEILVVAIAVEGGQPQIFVRQRHMYRTQLLQFLSNSPLTKAAM